MSDLVKASSDELGRLAERAFQWGLQDGKTRSAPITAQALMRELVPAGTEYRKIHRIKFRQVYGAGFDIGQCVKSILASEAA